MLTYFPPRYLFRRYEILRHIRPATQFLEVGAGNLQLAQALLHYFKKGKAIDFSDETKLFYQRLPSHIRQRLTVERINFDDLSDTDNYDCIVCCEVMEHIADDLTFLKKLYTLLNEKGQLLLSVPARMKYWSIHDEIVGHLRRYEKNEIIQLFERAGFHSVQVISYGYPFINLLRTLRIKHAKAQYQEKKEWSQQQQTKASGIAPVAQSFKWLGIVVNPYTFLPLHWFARLFNNYDLADGYLILAYKS